MHRIGPRDAAFRGYHNLARATINEANDDPKMQEVSVDFFRNDRRSKVERIQNYGFTAVPLPREASQTTQRANAEGLEPEKGPAAEAVVAFMGGQRNHPVVIAIDDRRHRPKGLVPGEAGNYDDQGQMVLVARDRVAVVSNKSRASLRHSSKKGKEAVTDETPNADIYVTATEAIVELAGTVLCHVIDGEVYLGAKKGEATFGRVSTEAGLSVNVYAKVG